MDYYYLNVLGGIRVLNSIVDAYRYAPHWHEKYVIAIYRDGAKKFRCAKRQGTARAGDLLIISPGTLHSAETFDNMGWNYLAFYLTSEQFSNATGRGRGELASKFQDFSLVDHQPGLARKALQALDAGSGSDVAFSEWLISLLNRAPEGLKESAPIPPYLVRVHERIMDDPGRPVKMGELSSLAGVTPEHLSRSFKRSYGVSPFQLLIAARIQTARKMAAKGASLAMAATFAGFSDQSHMNRWIKRSYGVSPGALPRDQ